MIKTMSKVMEESHEKESALARNEKSSFEQ
jgi:hypothetical protein